VQSAVFSKIEASDAAELDTERLKKYGEEVRHKDDEKKLILCASTGGDVRCIVPRVYVCHLSHFSFAGARECRPGDLQ
jgi:hypothetical protein